MLDLCGYRSERVVMHLDIAADCQRIRAYVTRRFNQQARVFVVHAGQEDVEPRGEMVDVLCHTKVNLGIDAEVIRQREPPLCGYYLERRKEARRPAGCEQLFRIRASARTSGN